MGLSTLQNVLKGLARDQQVLISVAKGVSMKETAHRMGIMRRRGNKIKQRAMARLDLHNTAQVVHHAIVEGWIKAGDVEK